MKFEADVKSLTVLVGEGKYCKFMNGVYETEDAAEIKALKLAKGVRAIGKTSENTGNAKTGKKKSQNKKSK